MSLTRPQALDFIKRGQINSEDKIAELLEAKIISEEDLKTECSFSPERINKVLGHIHLNRVRRGQYSETEIIKLVTDRIISKEQLPPAMVAEYFPPPPDTFTLMDDWENVPPLKQGRIDVFVLGVATSGKSCFMAGLIFYARKKGKLKVSPDNQSGYVYASQLTDAVKAGRLPPGTPRTAIQYMSTDFNNNSGAHPLTFIEMAGENFSRSFGKSIDKIPQKFNEYLLNSRNQKIFFLCIDYDKDMKSSVVISQESSQEVQFDYIMQLMEKHNVMKTTEAICIIVTKWDTCKDDRPNAINIFLEDNYLNLINLCKEYKTIYNLEFEIFPFSLGDFSKGGRYTYVDQDSENIFDWLCDFTPVKVEGKKK